jgi:hypothetical protein
MPVGRTALGTYFRLGSPFRNELSPDKTAMNAPVSEPLFFFHNSIIGLFWGVVTVGGNKIKGNYPLTARILSKFSNLFFINGGCSFNLDIVIPLSE